MSDITLIGLGAMGSAIARALLENKRDLTSIRKIKALFPEGDIY